MTSRSFLISLISFLIVGNTFAQEQQVNNDIIFHAFYKNGEVRLRWLIKDKEQWEWGNKVGYKITRKTVRANGVDLSFEDKQSSRVVLAAAYKPMSASEIDSAFPGNQNAVAAKGLLYDQDMNQTEVDPSEVSLAKAIEIQEKAENQTPVCSTHIGV